MLSKDIIIQRLCFNEGFRQSPYRCTAGKLTIGVGRNLDDCPLTKEELEFIASDSFPASTLWHSRNRAGRSNKTSYQ